MAQDGLRFLGTDIDYKYESSMVLAKKQSVMQYVAYMLDRTIRMFEYDGLPDTIPDYMLEQYLQTGGACAITDKGQLLFEQDRLGGAKSGLFAWWGSFGGRPDVYLRPTQYIVANPNLKESMILTIGKDCVLCKNDTRAIGLLPMFFRYAEQLVENEISIRSAQINSRQRTFISAATDRTRNAAEEYLNQLEAGEIAILGDTLALEDLKIVSAGSAAPNAIIQLIELQQYLKAAWFNDIGLNTNFNMKREYLSAEEIAANTDVLLPLVDDMLYNRQKWVEEVNSRYGTNISVKKGSSWDNKARESEAEIINMEDENANGGENSDKAGQPDKTSD